MAIADYQTEVLPLMNKSVASPALDLQMIRILQPTAERLVKNFVGFEIEQASYTEFLPDTPSSVEKDPFVEGGPPDVFAGRVVYGDGAGIWGTLRLNNLPVRDLSGSTGPIQCFENVGGFQSGNPSGTFPNATKLVEGVDFFQDMSAPGVNKTGFLYRAGGGSWFRYPRAYKVTYTAGFTKDEMSLGMLNTTIPLGVLGTGSQTVALVSAAGIYVGNSIVINSGLGDQETVTVTSVAGNNVTAIFSATHGAGATVTNTPGQYSEFKLACIQTLSKLYGEFKVHQEDPLTGQGGLGAITSERVGTDYAVQYDAASARDLTSYSRTLPRSAQLVLEPWIRLTKYLG
jgi:hypothetical protein